jgi:hypothetical protein
MSKRILTSSGKVIDLDKGDGVESIPPESLEMEKHSYGAYLPSQSFSVIFNGRITVIEKGRGQFFDEPAGERRLLSEIQGMKRFPRVFSVSLEQKYNGDVYYTIYLTINGVSHKLVLTYDEDHPEYQMSAVIEYPRFDNSRMMGHWYGADKPCYIQNWNRSWTALKVATQMRFWLEDYYNGKDRNSSYNDDEFDRVFGKTDRVLEEMKRSQNPWRLF